MSLLCSFLRSMHCITDQKPLLSSSQRWQDSRLVIGCAHYRERKTRGCWKHWRLGIIKVLPLSFSKLHLETSSASDLKQWHVFPPVDITKCNSCQSSFISVDTCSPPDFLSFWFLNRHALFWLTPHYWHTKKINLTTAFLTSLLSPICKQLTPVMFLHLLIRGVENFEGTCQSPCYLFRKLKDL